MVRKQALSETAEKLPYNRSMKKTYSDYRPYCWCEDVVAAAKLLDLTPEEVNRFMERKFKIRRQHRKRNFVRS